MKQLKTYLFLMILLAVTNSYASDIYVAPHGSDLNDGSSNKPFATVAAALRKARDLRRLQDPGISNGIRIKLAAGVYRLYEPLYIRPEDAGTAQSPLIIESASAEQAILSGGIPITGWKKLTAPVKGLKPAAAAHVWVADLPLVNGNTADFRQLWINGVKAIRAKNCNGDSMGRILSWNKTDASCRIPVSKNNSLENITGAEMFIHQWWAIANLRIRKIVQRGDSAQLFFHEPESNIQNEHPWPAPWISAQTGNSAFYLTNAIPFLDEPGEWFMDKESRKIYYWPRPGEDMRQASVVAPYLETLLQVEGTLENPVTNLLVKNISFRFTGWLRPSRYGHVPHQAGMYMLEAYKLRPAGTAAKKGLDNQAWIGRPAAAVQVSFARNTTFEGCRFEHLAATGLDYHRAVQHNLINGNLFKDIGGTALLAGIFADEAQEIHLAYDPADKRLVCDSMHISNNLVTNATNEHWSCVGIGLGYTSNSLVEHNEIENVSYTGISMGWGWNPAPNVMHHNTIKANSIHHFGKHNYDCAGIYTLSAQPGSLIAENYIDSIYKAPYAHLPSHWFYLYTDEGSSYITIRDNWTPAEKFLQNANGPGNEWSNNGPQVRAAVKQQAGLQAAYHLLKTAKTTLNNRLAVNREHPDIIELVVTTGKHPDLSLLRQVLAREGIDSNALYRWQNHYVVFARIKDMLVLEGKLKTSFPGITVRPYYDLFYFFDKPVNCKDTTVAVKWKHTILTADLVANPALQKEYLAYHASQFEQWPQVAQGFCNAGFQQLLLFRNGRQLMLIISIPEGESLDRLNPKTTENNPRVDEWNRLMKKYQQGIEGTTSGTVWVTLEQLRDH